MRVDNLMLSKAAIAITLSILASGIDGSACAQQSPTLEAWPIEPRDSSQYGMYYPISVAAGVRNLGTKAMDTVWAKLSISDTEGTLVYCDSNYVLALPPYAEHRIAFASKILPAPPRQWLRATLTARSSSGNEAAPVFFHTRIVVDWKRNLQAWSIESPRADSAVVEGDWSIIGTFGVTPYSRTRSFTGVSVRARVYEDETLTKLLFQADTLVSEFREEDHPWHVRFPRSQGVYDLNSLTAGTYFLSINSRDELDADRSDDTVFTKVEVVPSTRGIAGRADADGRYEDSNSWPLIPHDCPRPQQIRVFDALGREILSFMCAASHSVDSHLLPPGMYFLLLEGEDGIVTRKIYLWP